MARKPKPSHVVELPLNVNAADARRLLGVFTAGYRLNNVLLQDGLRILEAVRADPGWAAARALPRKTDEQRKARQAAFKAVRAAHGFTEYEFQALAIRHKNAAGFSDRLGSHVAQKLGSKVFAALDLARDEWLWSALQGEVKYCRVLWRAVGESRRYYAQLVMDGPPPKKASVLTRLASAGARAGLDLGPSNVAWVTATDAGLLPFCEEVVAPQKRIRQLQRKLDRQRRSNNPANFDAQGRARRGKTWETSARQRRTQAQLHGLQARCARQRANAQGRDINLLLERARHFHHDGVSVYHLKTSQYDHSSGAFVKKSLSQRWHVFADGRGACQRDVYSAFLALHAVRAVDEQGVITWAHDRVLLEGAWQELEPALRAKGLFRCGSEETGACIAPRAPLVKPSSTKARGLPLAGPQARGGARARTLSTASV